MIPISCFENKHIALFGLGASGIATAHALMRGGAQVTAFDDNKQACEQAKAAGIPLIDLHDLDWKNVSALILSPGVALTHPVPHWAATLAQQNGCEIIGDLELFARERAHLMAKYGWDEQDSPLIAITGTNGKSTTTALIAHLLRASGLDVEMGGNIGMPILALNTLKKGRFYVVECSSYQIDLAPSLKPTIAILTNLTPDHIDRHGSFSRYAAIKERLIAHACHAIIAIDDETTQAIAARLENPILVSTCQTLNTGWFLKDKTLFKSHEETATPIASLAGATSLRGQHNGQNALLAVAACDGVGLDVSDMQTPLKDFNGLEHRMEEVGRQGCILFINDSKATNAQATAPALASFDQIYWIVGGVAKEGGIEALTPYFHKIQKAYLIGQAAQDFHTTIADTFPNVFSHTLDNALTQAMQDAMSDIKSGKVTGEIAILLSPACASFDQFANYAKRGDAFRHLVKKMLGAA